MNVFKRRNIRFIVKSNFEFDHQEVDEEVRSFFCQDIKEQDVYLGDMPLMTSKVPLFLMEQPEQLYLKCIDHTRFLIMIKVEPFNWKILFASRLIPYNGSWIDFNLTEILYTSELTKKKTFSFILTFGA